MSSQLLGRITKRHDLQPVVRLPPEDDLSGAVDAGEGEPAFEPVDLFSGRDCPVDGVPMTVAHRDDRRRRWVCPSCGTRRR